MNLLILSLAPVFIILLYVYLRDRYEPEPIKMVLKAVLMGALVIFPVGIIENWIDSLLTTPAILGKAAFRGYVMAGFTEELFKSLAVIILIWRNVNFNEKFDGIVYAVCVSLGFAAVENIFYVLGSHSVQVGMVRALTAVPAHAIFGVVMGYYLGLARFAASRRMYYFAMALLIPWLLHGTYDFLLMTGHPLFLLLFIPFLFVLYRIALKRMRKMEEASPFNPANFHFEAPSEQETPENFS